MGNEDLDALEARARAEGGMLLVRMHDGGGVPLVARCEAVDDETFRLEIEDTVYLGKMGDLRRACLR